MTSVSTTAILRGILSDDMPRRFQNPKLMIRRDVPLPYYFLRVRMRSNQTELRVRILCATHLAHRHARNRTTC